MCGKQKTLSYYIPYSMPNMLGGGGHIVWCTYFVAVSLSKSRMNVFRKNMGKNQEAGHCFMHYIMFSSTSRQVWILKLPKQEEKHFRACLDQSTPLHAGNEFCCAKEVWKRNKNSSSSTLPLLCDKRDPPLLLIPAVFFGRKGQLVFDAT